MIASRMHTSHDGKYGHKLYILHVTNVYILVLNFTHRIDEFSFGQLYPNLINPLDNSVEIAETRKFYRQC